MGYKLTGMYIGTQKVRPTGWQPGANTIAYWELNGNAEDTKNDYGVTTYTSTDYDSDGYIGAGNPTYTTGRNGKQCAVFDGTRGLQLPGLPIPSNTLTISAWVNYTSSDAGHFDMGGCIFQLRTDNINADAWAVLVRIKANGTFGPTMVQTLYSSGGSGQTGYEFTGTALSTGTWHNVVYTFNGGVAKYYLDGSLMQTLSDTSRPYLRNTTDTKSYIGVTSEYGGGNQYYAYLTGKIQDVIYENVVWSDQEVADYYATY